MSSLPERIVLTDTTELRVSVVGQHVELAVWLRTEDPRSEMWVKTARAFELQVTRWPLVKGAIDAVIRNAAGAP